MKKRSWVCVFFGIAVLMLIVPVAAAPSLTVSALSQATSESWGSIVGPKNTWTSAETSEWMMGFMMIAPGSELDGGAVRYQYKYDIAAAGSPKSQVLYGPFPFSNSEAKMSRPVYALFSSYGPGAWEVRFYVTDTQSGADTLVATLPFWLTGGVTEATTAPTATTTSYVPTYTNTPGTPTPTATSSYTYPLTTTTTSFVPTYSYTTVTTTPTATVTTPALSGIITVTSIPNGAMVTLNGVQQGITPITFYNLPVGKHTVNVHDKGYTDNQTEVLVENQKTTQHSVVLLRPGAESIITQIVTPTMTPAVKSSSSQSPYERDFRQLNTQFLINEGETIHINESLTKQTRLKIESKENIISFDMALEYDPKIVEISDVSYLGDWHGDKYYDPKNYGNSHPLSARTDMFYLKGYSQNGTAEFPYPVTITLTAKGKIGDKSYLGSYPPNANYVNRFYGLSEYEIKPTYPAKTWMNGTWIFIEPKKVEPTKKALTLEPSVAVLTLISMAFLFRKRKE